MQRLFGQMEGDIVGKLNPNGDRVYGVIRWRVTARLPNDRHHVISRI